jgi:hypothetical protein
VTIRRLQHALLHARLLALCLLVIFFFPSLNPDVLPTAAAASSKDLKPNDPYALIFGTVWGPDDRPVYGITVKIRRAQDKKPKWQVYSDHSGEFAQRIAAGKADYIVWADLKGVKFTDGQPLHLVEEVPVHVEYDERVDIGLHLKR